MDDLIRALNLPIPNLLKIDVDGAEMGVLKGAERALEQEQLRSVLMEVHFLPGAESHSAIDYLVNEKKFRLAARYQRGVSGVYNCIFVRRE
jgi:hypothetical protein